VKIGNKAFRVLQTLAEQPGRLITKDALFETVWDGTIVSESALTSVVKELRRALGDETRTPRYIESVYGRGYRFIAPVEADTRAIVGAGHSGSFARKGGASSEADQEGPPLLFIPEFEEVPRGSCDPVLAIELREELVSALSRFRDVKVSEATPAGSGDARERHYGLFVKLVPGRGRTRAFCRLSHLRSGSVVWADAVGLIDDLAEDGVEKSARVIATAVLPRLHDHLIISLPEQPSDLYGRYFAARRRMRGLLDYDDARALALEWERLIALQQGMASAYPPLIRLYNTDFCYTGLGSTGERERSRAYALAHEAFALDPADSHLRSVKAWCHLWANEASLAREHFEQGLVLNPLDSARLIEAATGFMFLDELDRASELLEQRRGLASAAAAAQHEEEGLLRLLREDFRAAEEQLALVRRYHPDDQVITGPPITGELYAMLAAAGAGGEVAERARRWRAAMVDRWRGSTPPDDQHLKHWVHYHSPFQSPARRQWLDRLLDTALSAG
jgi:DNA-binding winged helix-turn-helix (wHTH) protein/tetratricopeptide (TPR) repeat protein